MKSTVVILAGLSLLFATAAAAADVPAAPAKPSVETTTIGDLLGNSASKAVIAKDMPDLIAYPGLDMIKGMTLRAISAYPEAKLDDAKLKAIQADLDAPGAAPAAAASH